ncbi:MAG TPA: hypothetical protein VJ521_02510, partial [Acidobacteriota bacterium]|nr:hypothetical protein [Acidobacteriota bacterium]
MGNLWNEGRNRPVCTVSGRLWKGRIKPNEQSGTKQRVGNNAGVTPTKCDERRDNSFPSEDKNEKTD